MIIRYNNVAMSIILSGKENVQEDTEKISSFLKCKIGCCSIVWMWGLLSTHGNAQGRTQ